MNTPVNTSYTDSFQSYIEGCKDSVRTESAEGYYHVNVVAEAYSQGFSDGEKSGKKDIINELVTKEIDKFTQRANQIYILSKNLIAFLSLNKMHVDSLFINLTPSRPSVIISVNNDLLNDDLFIEKGYSKMFEYKEIFDKLFNEILDIGFVASDNLDVDLLKDDGFGYVENYTSE